MTYWTIEDQGEGVLRVEGDGRQIDVRLRDYTWTAGVVGGVAVEGKAPHVVSEIGDEEGPAILGDVLGFTRAVAEAFIANGLDDKDAPPGQVYALYRLRVARRDVAGLMGGEPDKLANQADRAESGLRTPDPECEHLVEACKIIDDLERLVATLRERSIFHDDPRRHNGESPPDGETGTGQE